MRFLYENLVDCLSQTSYVFRLVKFLGFVAVLAMGMLSESWAKECNCGSTKNGGSASDCCWEIDSNGVLHITAAEGKSEVRMADYETIYDENDDYNYISYSTAPWANSNATKAVVGDGIKYIGEAAFASAIGMGEKAESINNATDMNLWDMDLKVNGITEVSGMNDVTEIGDKAFQAAVALTSVNMPNVETIGWAAFDSAVSLTSIDLPKVKTVAYEAFFGAESLISVYMPNVEDVGWDSFAYASSLESVYMPNFVKSGGPGWSGPFREGNSPNLSYIGILVDEQGCRLGEDGKRIEEGSSTCVSIPGKYSGTNISSCGQPGGSCNVCTDSSREGYDATKSVYKPSGTPGTSGTCVASGSCGTGYTEVNGLCKKNSSSDSQVSEASCYAKGQVFWNNACVDEFPFAKKHWTPAEAAQYLKDTDNTIIMTFKVNR